MMVNTNECEETSTKVVTQKNAFQYPKCWDDDERMAVLYAPFRERSVNVEGYDGKVKFWQELVMNYLEYKTEVVFSLNELQIAFMRNSRVPQCLDELLQISLTAGQVRFINEFLNNPLNEWSSWAINYLIKKPVFWFVNKLKTSFWFANADNSNDHAQFVHLPLMQKFCQMLETKILSTNRGKILHFRQLKNLLASEDIKLSAASLQLCLHTLHCQRKIFIEYSRIEHESQIDLIKIPGIHQSLNSTTTIFWESESAVDKSSLIIQR